jgi:hypothetical protein
MRFFIEISPLYRVLINRIPFLLLVLLWISRLFLQNQANQTAAQPEWTTPFITPTAYSLLGNELRGEWTTEEGRSNCTAFVRRANA